jgi:hypothetical protein
VAAHEYGYSSACGVCNLDESIETTIRCRRSFALPSPYVVLDDRGDAGVVVLDTGSPTGRVIWLGAHEVPKLATDASSVEDYDEFTDFPAWVSRCLRDAQKEIDS